MLTELEWRILHCVWGQQPITARALTEQIAEQINASSATLKTTLHRLVEKRVLRFQRQGNRYLYWANVSRAECIAHSTTQFVNSVFNGQSAAALAYLSESSRLSYDQVQYLLELLADIRDACADREAHDSSPASQESMILVNCTDHPE